MESIKQPLPETEIQEGTTINLSSQQPPSPPYPAILSGDQNVLIWDPKIATLLRKNHKVVGSLIGNMPPSNQFGGSPQGLPLALLPEETSVLLQEGIIRLETSELENTTATTTTNNYRHHQHSIPIWNWPQSQKDKNKLQIYSDLRSKGYFLTSGLKFGGDYLAYPGEPMRYHSHFIVNIVEPDSIIRPKDFVAMGRLGTTVKKSRLISFVESSNNRDDGGGSGDKKVKYISLDWAHMG